MSSLTSNYTPLIQPTTHRCWVEVDHAALLKNLAALQAHVPRAGVMAVVKANAYGHGLADVAKLLDGRVAYLGVANLCEARECRRHAPKSPIFILGAALPQERAAILAEGFTAAVSSSAEAAAYGALAGLGKAQLHLAIDTGMGRMGVWQEDALATAQEIAALPGVELTGICSHLPVSDEDDDFTRAQLARFAGLVEKVRALVGSDLLVHVENSAGAIGFPNDAHALFRAGLAMYGVAPRPEFQPQLTPALTWKTRVLLVRDFAAGRGVSYGRTFVTDRPMRVATLAVGYADGYPRQMNGKGTSVLIGGQRCRMLGRITMDQIMVDVSEVPNAAVGDEAVLLGRQGGAEIPATEMAKWAGTIAWDIFTGIGQRVVRVPMEVASLPASAT